jgi:hypothetical protein
MKRIMDEPPGGMRLSNVRAGSADASLLPKFRRNETGDARLPGGHAAARGITLWRSANRIGVFSGEPPSIIRFYTQ